MEQQQAYLEIKSKLGDRTWRLNNLYRIKSPQGEQVQFKMNWVQADFYANIHYFNAILKARQLGFTTFIMLYFLDACLFNDNHAAGVIAHTRNDAEELFKNKIRYAYDNLPDWLKTARGATQSSARKLEFNNGSSITVGTSLRSGTFQKLLVSEYGKIAARFPEKAKEIKTGALNTVHLGQQIFVESTAEGNQGEFFELCDRAEKLQMQGTELSPLDPRFHFYPWWRNPGYVLSGTDAANTSIDVKSREYFQFLGTQGIQLTSGQQAWYVKKAEQQGDEMKREFPSTPSESFEQSMEGAYFRAQMEMVRKNGQICRIPWEPGKPVHTFWDLGRSDYMAIWFFQHIGRELRFIRYIQAMDGSFGDFQTKMHSLGYVYGTHYFPHDGVQRQQTTRGLMTQKEVAESYGIRPIRIVSRTPHKKAQIEKAKTILPKCFFDADNAADGIRCLDNYRKEWDDRLGMWKDAPRHDESSHGADAFFTFTDGYSAMDYESTSNYGRIAQPIYANNDYNMLEY